MSGVTGKIAVVTGAARGLGHAIAKRLAADGARVIGADLDLDVLQAELPEAEKCFAVNVTDQASIDAMASHMPGPASILVNCAGITADAMIYKMTREKYRLALDINLAGSYRVTEALIPGMKDLHYGRIVHFSSRAYLGNIGQANYAASKGGVVGMTKAQALKYGPDGITVNAIAPGLIRTRLTDAIPADIRQGFINAIAIGRIGEPDDIASVTRFLVDEEAEFVSGQTLLVCGGRSVGAPLK